MTSSSVRKPRAREQGADLLGHRSHERGDHLRRPGELRPQLRPLGRDPDRAGVQVTRANHEAALREERRRAERVLVRAEQRGDHHVPAGLQPAVHAETDPRPKAALRHLALRLDQTELPRQAGVLDGRERRGARAAVGAGDVHHVGEGLHDAQRHGTDTFLGHELHRDRRVGVDLLEVEHELGEILDRVDVVMRRAG